MTPAVELHVAMDGPPEAPVVLLAHALGTSMGMWDPQLATLAGTFRVVRVDLRGHGRSPVPAGPYAIADLGRDLLAVLERSGIARASICGLSLGAMVGLWVAANAPERVTRLVAACVVARPQLPAAWTERAERVRTDGIASVADLVVERWGYRDRAPVVASLVREMLLATPAEGYAASCDAIASMDLRGDLPRVAAATLVIAGGHDPAAPPSTAHEIAAAIPGARVRIVEGAAHLANIEQPAAFTAAVLEHLREPAT